MICGFCKSTDNLTRCTLAQFGEAEELLRLYSGFRTGDDSKLRLPQAKAQRLTAQLRAACSPLQQQASSCPTNKQPLRPHVLHWQTIALQ